jgi:23S rRNA (adenine2503-C2)-methyltransferase
MKKQELKSLTRNELIDLFNKWGINGFRAKQVFNWIFKNNINDFKLMKNIPLSLIKILEERFYLNSLELKKRIIADDGTIKYLWNLKDNESIESVYIPFNDGRRSICISTQVGCAMACKFCATGLSGFIRNLSTGEIIDQVLRIQDNINIEKTGEHRITNVVFMGMGEPLDNLDSVLKAIEIINLPDGLNISMRKITVSTCGLVPQIKKLADRKLQIVLAISLNAPNNSLRNKIMPVNKKYPIEELINAARYYVNKTTRRISFEYVLMKGINDSIDLAKQLSKLLEGILCHVNLIPINPVPEFNLRRPEQDLIHEFKEVLIKNGIETTVRQERGSNIEAACGQLRRNELLKG